MLFHFFQDFITCLSLMCRGTIQEKLQWAFKLYDINGDGRITKKELLDIVYSVYALMGRKAHTAAEEKALREHVDKTFLVRSIFVTYPVYYGIECKVKMGASNRSIQKHLCATASLKI